MEAEALDMNVSKSNAIDIAREFIRHNIGQTPIPGVPRKTGELWIVPIDACYPKVIFDADTHLPKKRRFLFFRNIAEMNLSIDSGEVLNYPDSPQVNKLIRDKLSEVRRNVEESLTKVAAHNLARLPFTTHMTSPIHDIVSTLVMNNEFDMASLKELELDEENKYGEVVDLLCRVGVSQKSGQLVQPGPAFAFLEAEWEKRRIKGLPEQMKDTIGYVFAQGYKYHETISRILGPPLALCGLIYENSIENEGKATPILKRDLDVSFSRIRSGKEIKLNRYLVQLADVEMIDISGDIRERVVAPRADVLSNVIRERELLGDLMEAMAPAE